MIWTRTELPAQANGQPDFESAERRTRVTRPHEGTTRFVHVMLNINHVEVTETINGIARVCGSMMGHRVFRHRTFYCNFQPLVDLPHDHHGKLVGTRGMGLTAPSPHQQFSPTPQPNMWGVYSYRTCRI